MELNKNFKKLFYIIVIFSFFIQNIKCQGGAETYNKSLDEKCSSNLECNSACCSSDKCSKTSKCEKLVTAVYIAEEGLCLLFIIAFTVYLIIKLKKIKADFKKKTSPEDEQSHKQS